MKKLLLIVFSGRPFRRIARHNGVPIKLNARTSPARMGFRFRKRLRIIPGLWI